MLRIEKITDKDVLIFFAAGEISEGQTALEEQLKARKTVLPVLITHQALRIGPVFELNSPGCLNCLDIKDRVIAKLRPGLRNANSTPDLSADILDRQNWTEHVGSLRGHVLRIDVDQRVVRSAFIPANNCRTCHGRVSEAAPLPMPLVLDEPGIVTRENGLRSVAPEVMSERLASCMGDYAIIHSLHHTTPELSNWSVYHGVILQESPFEPVVACAGKGTTHAQARMSAIGEGIERYLASWQTGFKSIKGSFNQLSNSGAISARDFGYPIQGPLNGFQRYSDDLAYDWVQAERFLSGDRVLIPANLAFFPYRCSLEKQFAIQSTDGIAGGATSVEAALQGLLEIVERDAYWFVMRTRVLTPEWEQTDIETIRRDMLNCGLVLHLKDFTTDIGVPVAHAVLEDVRGRGPAFSRGSGAHLVPEIAVSRAVSEALQVRRDLQSFMRHYGSVSRPEDPHYTWCFPQVRPDLEHLLSGEDQNVTRATRCVPAQRHGSTGSVLGDLRLISESLRHLGMETVLVNLSRPEIPLAVVRALVTGIGNLDPIQNSSPRFKQLCRYFGIPEDIRDRGILFC